jgi:isoquinoline 1-oxidoreductase
MKEKEYGDAHFHPAASPSPLSRREFLKRVGALGGGIVIYFSLGDLRALAQGISFDLLFQNVPTDFNAFLRIGEDGRVSCFTGKIEMGQGIVTSLPQMMADELDVPLDSVDMLMGDTDLCPFDYGTAGSLTTRFFGPLFRAAAAEAKGVLMELASERLGVPLNRLKTKDGVIFNERNENDRVTYGQLAQGKKIARRLKTKPVLKSPSEFTAMGKSFPRLDAREKVTGEAAFTGDIRVPGMLYAKIVRPPAHGAKPTSVDTSTAREVEGVHVVEVGDLVACLHEHPDEAERALAKVKASFDVPEATVDDTTIFEHLLSVAPEERVVSQGGALTAGKLFARHMFEETYLNSYVAHAPMETHTALARIEGDKVTVWASTQTPFLIKGQIAQVLQFPPENVRVITPFVGGGFGGKYENNQVIEAARLTKLTGKPVQVARSRAEEFFYDIFRPAAVVKIGSGVDGSGRIVLWDYRVYFAGGGGAEQFYAVPHHRTAVQGGWERPPPGAHPFGAGPWRAPANNTNTFARESHIDIMAAKAGKDPLKFRLKNLDDGRMRRVLKACAEKFGWRSSQARSGRGYGVACGIHMETYVATMAEVEVDQGTGEVEVTRVVCVQDMGMVVNPEGAKMQMEGCVTMGLGYALTEEIHFKGGKISDLNFDTYTIPRFSRLPKIETVLIEAKEFPAGGCGEPPIICMGAVIANAVYDATGARLFQLPMTPERIKQAMKGKI